MGGWTTWVTVGIGVVCELRGWQSAWVTIAYTRSRGSLSIMCWVTIVVMHVVARVGHCEPEQWMNGWMDDVGHCRDRCGVCVAWVVGRMGHYRLTPGRVGHYRLLLGHNHCDVTADPNNR